MDSNSTPIVSAQQAPHKDLSAVLRKHQQADYKITIPEYARSAFSSINRIIQLVDNKIILDSGCGTGESSYQLARQYPQHWVVAIDKSSHRLKRSHAHGAQPDNLLFVQCNLIYFWLMAAEASWSVDQHYLLYPNPWPKAGHLQRRWHGHPVFPTLLTIGKRITLRTNWYIYAQEFAFSLTYFMRREVAVEPLKTTPPMTAFERKYQKSGHPLFSVETLVNI